MREGSGKGAEEGFIYRVSNQGISSHSLPPVPARFGIHHSPFSNFETVRQPHTGLTSDHSQLSIVELFRAEGAH